MQDEVIAIQRVGYLDTSYTWYQVLILSLYLSADVTTANVQDNHVYQGLTFCSLPSTTLKKTHYMVADLGYDDQNLYDLSMNMGFQLVCPVRRYKTTSKERLSLVDFYESVRTSDVFKENCIYRIANRAYKIYLQNRCITCQRYDKVSDIVLLSVLLYQILVYYNYRIQKDGSEQSST